MRSVDRNTRAMRRAGRTSTNGSAWLVAIMGLGLGSASWLMIHGCGANPGVGTPSDRVKLPGLASARALSNHYVQLSFKSSGGQELADPSNYVIRDTNDNRLQVVSATADASGTAVILTTASQIEGMRYTVIADSAVAADAQLTGEVGFEGSPIREPFLESAISLSNTSILLTFSEQLDQRSAENAAYYRILDPDGDAGIEISILTAVLNPDLTTVLLTTSPQENTEYAIQATNIKARPTCDDGQNARFNNTAQFTDLCSDSVRPFTDAGPQAEFRMTGRTRVAETAPTNPAAAGQAGLVSISAFGAGVRTIPCGNGQCLTGGGAERDEELILDLDRPMYADTVRLGLTQLSFSADDPVLFISSSASALYDYVITEAGIVTAYAARATDQGDVEFSMLGALPANLMIDSIKLRETAGELCAGFLCLKDGRRIDPTRSVARFYGIPLNDEAAPRLLSATPLGSTAILLSFSEPMASEAADASNYSISPTVTIVAAAVNAFGTQVALQTQALSAGETYTVTASNLHDLSGNAIDEDEDEADFTFEGQPVVNGPSDPPRVVGAISTSNFSVRVAFSKVMGDGLENPLHYQISGPDSVYLAVTAVDVPADGDRTYVDLTTLSQSPVEYRLHVVNVKDAAGNPLAAPDGVLAPPNGPDPASAVFRGTPPVIDDDDVPVECEEDDEDCICSVGDHVDTDCDGFADWFEQLGWFVTVHFDDGTTTTSHVTSDPYSKDTDGDGIWDGDENRHNFDPRTDDTDADQVTDGDEYNVYYSDPRMQDSDDDGMSDLLEIEFFRTSPILADTDGDGLTDDVELFERSRNPLIGDLPIPQITVDEISLELNVTSSYTDEEGSTQSTSETTSATFTDSRSSSLGTSSTNSTESENTFGQSIGVEGGTAGFTISGEVTFGQSQAQGYSTTVDSETSQSSQQEYQESVTNALEFSENRSVTRNIESAIVQATVNISNLSDIAFSITNIELSALQQDRITGLSFRPIATLRPTAASDPTGQPIYNIGPLEQERGPLIFENATIFPNRVDALMREPTGLVVKVVNYDVFDEFGRNLVFTTQEVMDKTAAVTIDFGDGRVELYRIATASTFDDLGLPAGISMERGLEIAGLTHAALSSEDRNTYTTIVDTRTLPGGGTEDTEVLVRVRDVQNSADGKKFWTSVTSNVDLDPDTDFRDIPLQAHDTFLIMYTSDVDEDGLFLREEYLYGSSDEDTDSDDDTLGDYFEVRTGWTVAKVPGLPYKTFPSPARADSDLDDLDDNEEFAYGTDPNRADTDEDGRSDASEIFDTYTIRLFDGDDNATNDSVLTVAPYSDWAIVSGPDEVCDTTTVTGDDVAVSYVVSFPDTILCVEPGPNGVIDTDPADDDEAVAAPKIDAGPNGHCETLIPSGDDVIEFAFDSGSSTYLPQNRGALGPICISAGANNEIDTDPSGDDFLRAVHRGMYGTDPVRFDTDRDGISDGREVLLEDLIGGGVNPNSSDAGKVTDTDRDGLSDDEEDNGWLLAGSTTRVFSDKNLPDSDRDGIPDVVERAIQTDPEDTDGDGDTLLDYHEFDQSNPVSNTAPLYDAVSLADALSRCELAQNCSYVAPHASLITSTHPAKADTDGDGRNDNIEVQVACSFTLYGSSTATLVFSDPLFAETEISLGLASDGRNDGQECDHASQAHTNPRSPDTDGDGRNDGAEFTAGRNPLRQDFSVTVTLIRVDVIDDCDDSTLDGLELEGSVSVRKPDNTEVDVYTPSCRGETINCGGHAGGNACCQSQGGTLACAGESYTVSSGSTSFVFQSGESFTLFTDDLRDHDDTGCGGHVLDDDIGDKSDQVNFSTSIPTTFNQVVGSGGCSVRLNWTISAN